MALGVRTLIDAWNDAEGLHHLLVSMPGTTGANLTQPEVIDLSRTGTVPTGGEAADLFAVAVHGMAFRGYQGAPGRAVIPQYRRAAAGAPGTGSIEFREVGAAGALALTADNTDLSATTFLLEFFGR